jgi:hypothetical protein
LIEGRDGVLKVAVGAATALVATLGTRGAASPSTSPLSNSLKSTGTSGLLGCLSKGSSETSTGMSRSWSGAASTFRAAATSESCGSRVSDAEGDACAGGETGGLLVSLAVGVGAIDVRLARGGLLRRADVAADAVDGRGGTWLTRSAVAVVSVDGNGFLAPAAAGVAAGAADGRGN